MVPRSLPLLPKPYPYWYDLNSHCEYHEGAPGHSLDGCITLKAKVRELINRKILSFKETGPNVENDPPPAHEGPIINAIEEVFNGQSIVDVKKVNTMLKELHT